LQHFEDFLNSVEVNRNLAKNRSNEVQIKSESLRIKVQSLKNRVELKFEELVEALTDQKNRALENFERGCVTLFEDVEATNSELNDRIQQFENILEQIGNIQQNV
jgi:hypothetical protein